tara:strand:- start:932 stop:3502 length:2571 start_codon:yes stop_codon:yes gene_type:complete
VICGTLPLWAPIMALAAPPDGSFLVPGDVQEVLRSRCIGCHGAETSESDIRLDGLADLAQPARLDLLNKAQDQLFLGLMPPEQAAQPTTSERARLAGWLRAELRLHNASKLDEKLRYPSYGNYVDHDQLFGSVVADVGWSPARRWLVNPQIFHERVMDVFRLEGRQRSGFATRQFHGVTNPFILPDHSGVRDYDITTLDGGHLLVMLDNARWIAGKQVFAARLKTAEKDRLLAEQDKRDRWYPKTTPKEFESIILADGPPTDQQMVAAIQEQFDCVLRRPADADELEKYTGLLKSSIALGGNTSGLQQMLVAILLESEFLYRLEFGGGHPDEHGRKKLTPREASYAISYALGDRRPDAVLNEAVRSGRLETRADYEREVKRLLADKSHFRGQVDPTLNGKHYRSNETSHPKIIRFFREFFGYPGALKVFKDSKRSEGKYRNPGRGSQATPGWLTLEADRIVTWHVEKDRDVFRQLLTSDEFFVYHNKDNRTGRRIIDEWQAVYDRLKTTPWKTEPQRVLDEHLEFLKKQKSMRIVDNSRPGELVNYMHYFEESLGQGRTPFTTHPWAHGYTLHHSPFYSLPPTPSIGRYGSWKSTKYNDKLTKTVFWDYPVEQPFRIKNRKGILTHPAWLIAHSTNFHSDPVRRGRWIREKLLAGRVPDVPITVDAQVPDDPHRTFRARVESVTGAATCRRCHRQMNPLGLAFEMYDDFGRYRTVEALEHPDNLLKSGNGKTTFDVYKTAPVVTTGRLEGTGEPGLDGEVSDALDMIDRLARSSRVRQSIIRHAFRFFMGRNEMLSDSRTLRDADRAYTASGGSFRAVVVSLLTSDSFMYRKDTSKPERAAARRPRAGDVPTRGTP